MAFGKYRKTQSKDLVVYRSSKTPPDSLDVESQREQGAVPAPGFRGAFAVSSTPAESAAVRPTLAERTIDPQHADGRPGNASEREADRAAAQVVSTMDASISRNPAHHRERHVPTNDVPHTKPVTGTRRGPRPHIIDDGVAPTSDVRASIQRLRGSGQSLADNIKEPMERAFGTDFSGVRVHTDRQSDGLNQSVQARAFTTGQDVFFRAGEYDPASRGGRELLAHELAHVVQQKGRSNSAAPIQRQRKIFPYKPGKAVMDNISPNKAAQNLNLTFNGPKSWEWLHLVAFSIGQTHVSGLSKTSEALIKKTDQPQQIRENLVLGTAAANTEMLSYETLVKNLLKQNPDWKANLVVFAAKDDVPYKGGTIPLARSIEYHFLFETGPNTYSPPFVVVFDTRSHEKPATESFAALSDLMAETLKEQAKLKETLKGPSMQSMESVENV